MSWEIGPKEQITTYKILFSVVLKRVYKVNPQNIDYWSRGKRHAIWTLFKIQFQFNSENQ